MAPDIENPIISVPWEDFFPCHLHEDKNVFSFSGVRTSRRANQFLVGARAVPPTAGRRRSTSTTNYCAEKAAGAPGVSRPAVFSAGPALNEKSWRLPH